MPSHSQFLQIILDSSQTLTKNDRLALFTLFGRLQKPVILAPDLKRLVEEQRHALSSVQIEYKVQHIVTRRSAREAGQRTAKTNGKSRLQSCVFVRDDFRLLLSDAVVQGTETVSRLVESYDGRLVRSVLTGTDIPYPNASIQYLDYRSRFFTEGNPLLCARQVDSTLEYGRERASVDLARAAVAYFIYEHPELHDGRECVVLGNFNEQILCDPSLAFAVVLARSTSLELDAESQKYRAARQSHVLENDDFTRVDSHVWLPRRCEYRAADSDGVVAHFVTSVTSYTLSPAISHGTFADIIPDGAAVADAVTGRTYFSGSRPHSSFGSAGSGEDDGPRSSLSSLLIVNLAAALLLLFLFAWRLRRRRHRNSAQ